MNQMCNEELFLGRGKRRDGQWAQIWSRLQFDPQAPAPVLIKKNRA